MPNIINIDSPICVGGSGRSGTSWVMDMLGAKSDVQYVLENSLVYSLYRELNSSWWSEIFYQIECDSSVKMQQAKTIEFIRGSLCRLFPSELRHWLLKIIWGVCRTWGVPLAVWVELFPNARYVHCVRDPRETITSIMEFLGSYSNASNQTSAEHQFLRGHLDMLELKSMGVSCLTIKLEEIKDAPEAVYEQLCQFCGLLSEQPAIRIMRNKSAAREHKPESQHPSARVARALRHRDPRLLLPKREIRWNDLSRETVELSTKLGYFPDCDPETLRPLLGESTQDVQSLQDKIATLATENTELKKRISSLSKRSS